MSEYVTPDEVAEIIPGMNKAKLSQLRFRRQGPPYYKPTPRTIVYKRSEVIEWIESTRNQEEGKK